MHNRLFNKPHGSVSGCTLNIIGTLLAYTQGLAYSGRLSVSGARGPMTLTSWTGDLPPGAQVSFDDTAQQIVVSWPAYSPGSNIDAANLDFEDGDIGWEKDAGISIVSTAESGADPETPGSQFEAQFANQGGTSHIMNKTWVPAVPGKLYTASCRVNTGFNHGDDVAAAARLLIYDAGKNQIAGQDASPATQPDNKSGIWATSTTQLPAPGNAAFVRVGASMFRRRKNLPFWVDNISWNGAFSDGSTPQGTNGSASYPVTFTVRDSMGCRATWVGVIDGLTAAAHLNFNDGYTDSTGRVWAVNVGTSFDGYSTNVAVPLLAASPAAEGSAMTITPDIAPDAQHPGGVYRTNTNANVQTTLGDDAPGSGEDFCIEFFERVNVNRRENGDRYAAFGIILNGATDPVLVLGMQDSAAVSVLVSAAYPGAAWESLPQAQNFNPGTWQHVAFAREKAKLRVFIAGQLYGVLVNANNLVIAADTSLFFGSQGFASTNSFLSWMGQIDDILITTKGAKYTDTFTPPTPGELA